MTTTLSVQKTRPVIVYRNGATATSFVNPGGAIDHAPAFPVFYGSGFSRDTAPGHIVIAAKAAPTQRSQKLLLQAEVVDKIRIAYPQPSLQRNVLSGCIGCLNTLAKSRFVAGPQRHPQRPDNIVKFGNLDPH